MELIRRTPLPPKEPKSPKPKPPSLPAVIEIYAVDRVEFSKHTSRDSEKAPSLKIHYYSGLRVFHQWLCLEHDKGFPRHKAHEAWRQMAGYEDDPPETVDEALELVGTLRLPKQIRVLRNGKFDEVVGYEFGERVATRQDLEDVPF